MFLMVFLCHQVSVPGFCLSLSNFHLPLSAFLAALQCVIILIIIITLALLPAPTPRFTFGVGFFFCDRAVFYTCSGTSALQFPHSQSLGCVCIVFLVCTCTFPACSALLHITCTPGLCACINACSPAWVVRALPWCLCEGFCAQHWAHTRSLTPLHSPSSTLHISSASPQHSAQGEPVVALSFAAGH